MDCEKVRDMAVSEMEAEIEVQEHSHEMSAQAIWLAFLGVSVAIIVFGLTQGEEGEAMAAAGAGLGILAMLVFWSSERRIRSAFRWLRNTKRAIIEHEFERCIEAHGPADPEEE